MQKREVQDSELAAPEGAPATPRADAEHVAGPLEEPERARSLTPLSAELSPPSEPSDTLLSAGKPADRLEVLMEDRLAGFDERLRELEARVSILERRRPSAAPEPRQKPWLWIAFLIALVVVFQLLHRVR